MNVEGPIPLDLRIVHEQWGSRCSPSLNGKLHYLDRPLNEGVIEKILQYCVDYNNRPSNTISFLVDVVSTSDRLYCEFVYLLFLQTHRETDRFLTGSGDVDRDDSPHVRLYRKFTEQPDIRCTCWM